MKFMVEKIFGVVVSLGILSFGCVKTEGVNPNDLSAGTTFIVGTLDLESTGPYFRPHQSEAQVKFLDVMHVQTGDRVRVTVQPGKSAFITPLQPGTYELFRIQIGEGPFRSEAHLDMTFEVHADSINHLGDWHLQVDPPKTVRMLTIEVDSEPPSWEDILESYPDLRQRAQVESQAQPMLVQVRVFGVAPVQPRSKYFRRR